MMKWLRKHSKRIMVGLVLMAMFSFVGGSALQGILSPSPEAQVQLHAFGERITGRQLQPAQNEWYALSIILDQLLGQNWQRQLRFDARMEFQHWYLLVREAEKAGILVPESQVDRQLSNIGKSMNPPMALSASSFRGLGSRAIFNEAMVRKVFADFFAVMENAGRIATSAMPSEPEVRKYVQDTEEKIRVKLAVLDAEVDPQDQQPIPDEELRTQFEKYKDTQRGSDPSGYGYAWPQRVKVEYLRASILDAMAQVQATDEELKSYYWKNKDQKEFQTTEMVEVPADTQPAASQPAATQPGTTQPSTQPATKKVPKPRQKTYSEALPALQRAVKLKKATAKVRQAMQKATNELIRPWADLPTDQETGYKPIPPEVRDENYMKQLRDQLVSEFGIPVKFGVIPLSSKEELGKQPGIGEAETVGETSERLESAEYAFRVPPFFKPKDASDSSLRLQLFQTSDTPLTASQPMLGSRDEMGQELYIFRVVEAREAESPKEPAEVREQVEHDLRMKRAYEGLEPAAKKLYAAARKFGLNEGTNLLADVKKKIAAGEVQSPSPFPRRVSLIETSGAAKYMEAVREGKPTLVPPAVPAIGSESPEFVEACFEMAQAGWTPPPAELLDVPELSATTKPAAEPAPVVRLVGLPALHKWAVVEFERLDGVHDDEFENQLRARGYDRVEGGRSELLRTDWFKLESIEKRCGFLRLNKEGKPAAPHEGILPHEAPPQAPVF